MAFRLLHVCLLSAVIMLLPEVALAQVARAEPPSLPEALPEFKRLAPGVLRCAPLDPAVAETYSRHDMLQLLNAPQANWPPQFTPETNVLKSMAKDTVFRREVWNLQFCFKPVRFLQTMVPAKEGRGVEPKLIWYLMFRVTNPGGHLETVLNEEGVPQVSTTDSAVRFVPRFWLEAHDPHETVNPDAQPPEAVTFHDRLLPVIIPEIQRRESPPKRLVDRVSIGFTPIPVDKPEADNSVWGVATWDDVPAATDRFTIYVQGLTNAYQWQDVQVTAGDGTKTFRRQFLFKTLLIHFWRPGDPFFQDEGEIRVGAPGQVAYEWKYLPVD